jgi:hypothetical protein
MPTTAELVRTARLKARGAGSSRPGAASNESVQQYQLNPLGAYSGEFASGPYASWLAGTPMSAALPREVRDFIQGAFGPAEPIMPQPIDVPPDGSDRPTARRLQYPIFWNLPVGIPGAEGIKVAPFQTMRMYAERYSVVRACIEVRKREIVGTEWDIVPTKATEKQMRNDTELREDWMKRRERLLEFWRKPDNDYTGFRSWIGSCLEEVFVTDSLSIGFEHTRGGKAGLYGTDIKKLRLIDGTTIRPLYAMSGDRPKPPNPAYQQYIWGVPRTDLAMVATEEDAEEMSDEVKPVTTSELMYLPLTKRVWTPYGFSPVEMSLVPQAIGLSRQAYFLDYFQEGSMPGAYIIPGPEVTSAAQRKQLQDALNALAGDIGHKFRIVVLPAGSSKEDTKEVKLADGSDTIIAELVMMCFAVQSEEIGMVPGGKSQGMGGSAHAAAGKDIAQNNRKKPLAGQLKDSLFNYINQELFGQDDMDWSWEGLEEAEDKQAAATAHKIYIDDGVITRDEVRGDLGYEPFSLPLTGSPTVTTGSGVVPLDPGTPITDVQGGAPPAPPAIPGAPPQIGPDGKPLPPTGGPEALPGAKPAVPGAPPSGGLQPHLQQGVPGQVPGKPGEAPAPNIGHDGKPVAMHPTTGKPVTSDGKPATPDGKPLAPTIGPDGKPYKPEDTQHGPDGKPLPEGAAGVDHEGKPVGEDGKPIPQVPMHTPGEPMVQGTVPMGMTVQEHQEAGHIPTKDALSSVQEPDAPEGEEGTKPGTKPDTGQDPKAKADQTDKPDASQGHVSPGRSVVPTAKVLRLQTATRKLMEVALALSKGNTDPSGHAHTAAESKELAGDGLQAHLTAYHSDLLDQANEEAKANKPADGPIVPPTDAALRRLHDDEHEASSSAAWRRDHPAPAPKK